MSDIEEIEPMDLQERADDIEYSFETIREEVFLDIVYADGEQMLSRITALQWIAKVSAERTAGWLFDPQMTRSLIFDKTGIDNND